MNQASPLSDFRHLVQNLPPLDLPARDAVRGRLCGERPANRVEALAMGLAAVQGKTAPAVRQAIVTLFAAAHGVASRGVALRPASRVAAAVEGLGQGGLPLNGLCAGNNLGLKVYELAPQFPTADFTAGPALDGRACAATIAFGMEAVAGGADLLGVAGLAAGSATSAAAIGAALAGGTPAGWVGSDLPDHVRLRRIDVIGAALARHKAFLADPLEVLARLGGRETAAIAGAIAAARVQKALVLLDGEAAAAAALVLHALRPDAVSHCFLAHRLRSPALGAALEGIGLPPLLDLGLREAGEAGALAAGPVRSAAGMVPAASAPSS